MDGSLIAGLASSLSSAASLSKTLLGMKIDTEVRDAVIAIQSDLISAQSAALQSLEERDRLYRRIQDLESEINRRANWAAIAAKFEPYETSLAFAYQSSDQEFKGLYCPKCFENERLARLQESKSRYNGHVGRCLQCETKLKFESGEPITPTVVSF